jgi:hypothetical protein
MGGMMNGASLQEITLDVEQLAAQQVVSREWLKHIKVEMAESPFDWDRGSLTLRMIRQIATVGGESVTVPEIRVPDGLWHAFKERWFGPLLRWTPVRYRVLQHAQTWKAVEMLPNVDLPESYRVGAIKVLVQR